MVSENYMLQYVILALLWIYWCVLHSAFISISVMEFARSQLGENYRYYRIFYNIFSTVSFVVILLYEYTIHTESFFQWRGSIRIVQIIFIFSALTLFYYGSKHYDFPQFLGLRHIKKSSTFAGITTEGALSTSGILKVIRHPWYLGAILIIWTRSLDTSRLITNLIFTSYLIIGAFLEERKLIHEFGWKYREYRKNVSMFLPFKWVKKFMK